MSMKQVLALTAVLCLAVTCLSASAAITDPNIITGVVRYNPDDNSGDTEPAVVNGGIAEGVLTHVDRTFVITEPNDLTGVDFIQTCVDDKDNPNLEIDVTVDKAGTLFLLIDNRVGSGASNDGTTPPALGDGVMDWAVDAGFVPTSYTVGVLNPADSSVVTMTAYALELSGAGTTTLFAQNDGGSRLTYLIAAIPAGWNLAPSVTGLPASVQVEPGGSLLLEPAVVDYGENTVTTVQWSQVDAGPAVVFSPDAASEAVTVTFPGGLGDYTLKLTAMDGDGLVTEKTVDVSVQIPTFAVQCTNWCQACNDPDKSATSHVKTSRHYARNHSAPRRRIEFIQYDISEVKEAGKVFANSFLTMNRDKGSLNEVLSVFAIREEYDNVDLDTGSWSNLPGVDNTPVPPQSEPITIDMLDHLDISPLLIEDTDIPLDVWYDTPTSAALDEVLNADDDGTILLMFVTFSPEDADLEIRSPSSGAIEPVTGKAGIILRGNMATPTWATNPVPTNNTNQGTSLAQLSWTNPAGVGEITASVYLGTTEPNYLAADYGYTLLGEVTENYVTIPAGTLTVDTQYYWIVDIYDAGTGETSRGFLWTFGTGNKRPVVEIEKPFQYLWLDNAGDPTSATVEINASVTDDGNPGPYTLFWEQISGPTVVIDPNDVEDLTLVLPQTGTYTFQLSADDGDLVGSAATEIVVAATPCDAAKAKPDYLQNPADFDNNCYVDLEDFAVFAVNWLTCNPSMDAPCW